MSKWLQSGLRRDVCVVVASEGDPTQQTVKRAIERKNDERIRPKRFNGAVRKLDDAGIVEREADGVHDRLSLTDAGATRLREHREWVDDRLADWRSGEGGDGEGGDGEDGNGEGGDAGGE